ncbi:CBASS cGAMP-activated phospholipase [Leptothoe sp. PORK10 BA2]|uniref:CBASS cGAMP-activated phospholipase n=1 Tax=Leptothoe sp. PORK10 BA2 TaxID=3110254 RepID=UPI002B2011F6|nr:CBASS cGAMP-activated phospholipase [Leptothoe sp. PORK10 BA2]MEA5466360.1 CBASS cGAMP-activated phospholipase [Leptothoe sp. PORK10 BA2]
MTRIYRILSIDGGGIKGVFPAAFLATLEDAIGDHVANYFDLIVGTSTGGIVALGLGLGLSATEILGFYERYGPQIFQQRTILSGLRHWLFAKYSDATLRQALEETFGDRRLGESNQRLVIPSLNLDTGEAYLYKTAHHRRFERDYKELVVTVALATSAAPTFFPTHLSEGGTAFIDGGVWANNPAAIAMIEAVKTLQWNPETVRLLSLGCSTPPVSVGWERWLPLGKVGWANRVVEMVMAGQSSFSLGAAQLFAGEENVLRVDPIVQRNRFAMDGAENIAILKGLGQSEARKELPKLRQLFLTEPAPHFVPEWQLDP